MKKWVFKKNKEENDKLHIIMLTIFPLIIIPIFSISKSTQLIISYSRMAYIVLNLSIHRLIGLYTIF